MHSFTPVCHPVHHWLCSMSKILHHNPSPNNIMFHFTMEKGKLAQKVYGVLTDYNLSSWTSTLNPNYMITLQQWTRTPLYMAYELLSGSGTLHLYRHDVELLFYMMLLTVVHHLILTYKGNRGGWIIRQKVDALPYKDWFGGVHYPIVVIIIRCKYSDNLFTNNTEAVGTYLMQILWVFLSNGMSWSLH